VIEQGAGGEDSKGRSPTLTAEGVVGGVLAVVHARLLQDGRRVGGQRTPLPLTGLLNPLMSMIVLPYLGTSVARRELARPVPPSPRHAKPAAAITGSPSQQSSAQGPRGPLNGLPMRLTYRTLRVLAVIAANPGISNRQVADHAEVHDQGQMSKLLARLLRLGLIINTAPAQSDKPTGAANAWTLTPRGHEVQAAIGTGPGL
jgi:DNA-binding MarR family transcriptional regulator